MDIALESYAVSVVMKSILGDTKDLDMEALKKIGPVTILTQEEIFGY